MNMSLWFLHWRCHAIVLFLQAGVCTCWSLSSFHRWFVSPFHWGFIRSTHRWFTRSLKFIFGALHLQVPRGKAELDCWILIFDINAVVEALIGGLLRPRRSTCLPKSSNA